MWAVGGGAWAAPPDSRSGSGAALPHHRRCSSPAGPSERHPLSSTAAARVDTECRAAVDWVALAREMVAVQQVVLPLGHAWIGEHVRTQGSGHAGGCTHARTLVHRSARMHSCQAFTRAGVLQPRTRSTPRASRLGRACTQRRTLVHRRRTHARSCRGGARTHARPQEHTHTHARKRACQACFHTRRGRCSHNRPPRACRVERACTQARTHARERLHAAQLLPGGDRVTRSESTESQLMGTRAWRRRGEVSRTGGRLYASLLQSIDPRPQPLTAAQTCVLGHLTCSTASLLLAAMSSALCQIASASSRPCVCVRV